LLDTSYEVGINTIRTKLQIKKGEMYLNEYEIEKITRLATEVATKTYYELAKKENAQLGRKLRHNTIKLLKHYSQLQSYVDNAITDSTQAEDIWLNELLIDMFDDKSIVKVNAIVKSKEKTALMMRHVNNMLDIYAEKCNTKQFKYCECMRRYYIDGETLEEIAESFPEKPDVRTIHRYIARGIEELSVLLWGVIGLNTKLS